MDRQARKIEQWFRNEVRRNVRRNLQQMRDEPRPKPKPNLLAEAERIIREASANG
jgi:hypothetical protein